MLKVLHTADWHIGNFPGPANKNNINVRFQDICSYIEFLIDKVKTLTPDIIIIAGDVFNQAKTWSDRGLQETGVIIKYLTQLSQTAPVCILRGTPNHDGKMHFDLLNTALENDDNIIIVDEPCVKNINNLAAVAFVPIFDRNAYRAESENTFDKEAENNFFCDKVRDAILDLKPQADAYNLPTILVTHYTVLGATMPNGQTSIFANHEVVIDPITLIQGNYWLTCLGHIHKPQQLETCPSAFYSGSLCALNFNDEKDSHGFYMHYVYDRDNIKTEFIQTPSRAFRTIWLDDNQLNDIISRDYDLTDYFMDLYKDSIIRVIYTCTDVTNKKLNKAILEKALYKYTGAFYVQEIVPSDIVVTVDKTAMRNTASIEDNLLLYLQNEQKEHGSITDNQIRDIMSLAQPIIDDLTADITVNQNIGVFTPIEIEVKNYRNYQNAVFNYKDVNFCVINGENGAGKSSLFMDAMLDALFEDTREGDITGWINNDISVRSGSIKFTFSIGDNIYKITRTRQKSGKATLNLAGLGTDEDGNEAWIDMSEEKLRDTQDAINKLVGMDAITLKSCGLIMQDAYGLFLQADKATRLTILSNILGLNIYNELNDAATEFSQICQREINKANDEENAIMARLKDGKEIQKNLDEARSFAAQYEKDMQTCNNMFTAKTTERETLLRNIELYNKFCDDIDNLNAKKAALETALGIQKTALADAEAVIATEAMLETTTQRYNELVAKEKAMSDKLNQMQTLMALRTKLEEDLTMTDNIDADADNKLSTLAKNKQAAEIELAGADDISAKAKLYEQTKAEIAAIETKISNISELEKQRDAKTTELQKITFDFNNQKVDYDAKVAEINKKADILAESDCPDIEHATCKFLADAKQALAEKPGLDAAYAQTVNHYTQAKTAVENEINELNARITELKRDLPDLTVKKQELAVFESCAFKMASIPEIRKNLAIYEQQIADFKQVKAENEAKRASIIEKYNENTQNIKMLTDETVDYDKIKAEIAAIGDLSKQRNDIIAAKTAKDNATRRIAELEDEIKANKYDIYNKVTDRRNLKIDPIAVTELNADIMACQTQQSLLSQNIAENGKVIGQLELELKQYKDDISQLDKLKRLKDKSSYMAANGSWLKKAFSRDGIPHNIIRSVIPVLETTASNILNQMSNNAMSIELRTERMLTNKKEVATLDVIVCDAVTGDLPYLSRSGGERVKAALSVVLALAEIKSSESGTQLGFLFIDEPPFLDSHGVDAYCDALEAIRQRYNNLKIMAITHDPAMKSRFSQSIEIAKTDHGSEVYANL